MFLTIFQINLIFVVKNEEFCTLKYPIVPDVNSLNKCKIKTIRIATQLRYYAVTVFALNLKQNVRAEQVLSTFHTLNNTWTLIGIWIINKKHIQYTHLCSHHNVQSSRQTTFLCLSFCYVKGCTQRTTTDNRLIMQWNFLLHSINNKIHSQITLHILLWTRFYYSFVFMWYLQCVFSKL